MESSWDSPFPASSKMRHQNVRFETIIDSYQEEGEEEADIGVEDKIDDTDIDIDFVVDPHGGQLFKFRIDELYYRSLEQSYNNDDDNNNKCYYCFYGLKKKKKKKNRTMTKSGNDRRHDYHYYYYYFYNEPPIPDMDKIRALPVSTFPPWVIVSVTFLSFGGLICIGLELQRYL